MLIYASHHPVLRSIAAVLLVTLTAGACAEAAGPRRALPDFTGEELYQGTVLMNGPVARAIPQIRDNLAVTNFVAGREALGRIEQMNGRLISAVRGIDPRFFDYYRAELTSGDQIRVQRAMERAGQLTLKALNSLQGGVQARQAFRNPDAIVAEAARRHAEAGGDPKDFDEVQARRALAAIYDGIAGDPGANPLFGVAVLLIYFGGVVVDVLLVSNYGVFIAIEVKVAVASDIRTSPGNLSLLHEQVIDGIANTLRR